MKEKFSIFNFALKNTYINAKILLPRLLNYRLHFLNQYINIVSIYKLNQNKFLIIYTY